MKKYILNLVICISVFAATGTSANAAEVKVIEAAGLKAWVIEDHILPIVSMEIAFKNAGSAHDAMGKEGLSYQVASMLNEGAGEYSSQQYQTLLEEDAITFAPDIDKDNFYISVKTLTENLDTALHMTNVALTTPQFNPDDLERIKRQTVIYINKIEENETAVASRAFAKALFKEHPYAKPKEGEVAAVEKLTPDDLHGFVNANFAKDNAVISIVGDVDDEAARNILEKLAANLPEKSKTTKIPAFTEYPKGPLPVVKVKMANPQTFVLFGERGIARDDKDYYAAYILNHILGGDGFSAHLVSEVREKNGLAYSVGTQLQSMQQADLLVGEDATKTASVDKSIKIIQQEFKKISEKGVTPDELKDAKDYIIGSFGLNLDKNENLAAFLISMQIYNLGTDYMEKRNNYFKKVTVEQVNDLAKRMIVQNNLLFVRVGM